MNGLVRIFKQTFHLRQNFLKDAKYSTVPGEWGVETEWTKGDVGADAFIAALRDVGYDGYLAVELEAGENRAGDIAAAVADVKGR